MLNLKTKVLFSVITAFVVFTASSCVVNSKYGMLRAVPVGGERITFEKLKENFQDYHIYWSGTQKTNVIAYLFDPKNDDRTINTHEWWTPVASKQEMKDLWIFGNSSNDYPPEIYSVFGPDNDFYGYLYTSWHYVWKDINIVKVDEKTLWIDFIPVPDWSDAGFWEGL